MNGVRFVDVCLTIRDLYSKVTPQNPQAPIQIAGLLIPAVQKRLPLNFAISLSRRTWRNQRICGGLFRFKTRAIIVYSHDLNMCWRRFVICKELAHLIIDTDDNHFTQDPVSLVQQMITDVPLL